jgi:glycosyltransferase involved in cell wall biosynthesis
VRRISDSSFTIVWNGTIDSPPAPAVRDFLLEHEAQRVTAIWHPLEPEHGTVHRVAVYDAGHCVRQRSLRLPSVPPLTYAFDPFVPVWPERVDCWIGFNNLAAARGLLQRWFGRAGTVAYWAVDFVPNRFGTKVLTRLYDQIDTVCCKKVDMRFEVSAAALEGRNAHHGLRPGTTAPALVAPMGAWLARVPVTADAAWKARKIVFLGHLVRRQGVGTLIEALALLSSRGVDFKAEIAGQGPLAHELRATTTRLGLDDRVTFLGFLSDHRCVEAFVASGSIAVAPYDTSIESFTRFADPSKIRAYTAAGLPVIMTDVPANAYEVAAEGGGEVVAFTPEAIADAIERLLASPEEWRRRRQAALRYAQRFDWERIVAEALGVLGFTD